MTIKAPAFVLLVTAGVAFPLVCRSQPSTGIPDLEAGKHAFEQGDYAAALKQLTPLAQQGNADAQVVLGKMNLNGKGVAKDPAQALKWYQASAEQGNPEGQFFVGSMYLMGAGVPHDTALGMKWLGSSAGQGNSDSQVLLGLVYFQGHDGVPRDLVQADVWFQLAAARGDPLAPRQTEAVEKQMTPGQLARAKALVAAWKPNSPSKSGADKRE